MRNHADMSEPATRVICFCGNMKAGEFAAAVKKVCALPTIAHPLYLAEVRDIAIAETGIEVGKRKGCCSGFLIDRVANIIKAGRPVQEPYAGVLMQMAAE